MALLTEEKSGIVVYTSRGGATKAYAQAIAQACGFDLKDARSCPISKLQGYKTIIYGGGLYHDKIDGINYLMDNISFFADATVIVFAVGISPVNSRLIEAVTARSFGKIPEEFQDNKIKETRRKQGLPFQTFKRIPYLVALRGAFDPQDVAQGDKFFAPADAKWISREVKALKTRANQKAHLTPGEKIVLDAVQSGEVLDFIDTRGITQVVQAVKTLG